MTDERRDSIWRTVAVGCASSLITVAITLGFNAWQSQHVWHRDQRLVALEANVSKNLQAKELVQRIAWFASELDEAQMTDSVISNELSFSLAKDTPRTVTQFRASDTLGRLRAASVVRRLDEDVSRLQMLLFEAAFTDEDDEPILKFNAWKDAVGELLSASMEAAKTARAARRSGRYSLPKGTADAEAKVRKAVGELEVAVTNLCTRAMERLKAFRS